MNKRAWISEMVLPTGRTAKVLKIFEDPNQKYPTMSFGVKKAKLLLEEMETIKKFVNTYSNEVK